MIVLEQTLNGLQYGVMLFLMAAGLTLVFGIMNLVNLAHGSLYMVGAYLAIAFTKWTGSFAAGVVLALAGTLVVGVVVEVVALRTLYERDHLDQVLATFGLILFFNELIAIVWGRAALYASVPAALSGHVMLLPGVRYPVYRALIIVVGLVVAALLWLLVTRTRVGMLIRAGASNRTMVAALGNLPPNARSWSQFPPPSQRSRGVFLSNSARRLPNSASSFASLSSTRESCCPPPRKCACESWNPGTTRWPPRSVTFVFGPASCFTSASVPTRRIRPRHTATACASGFAASTVHTRPLTKMASAATTGSGTGELNKRRNESIN